jgi:hypothetical protein
LIYDKAEQQWYDLGTCLLDPLGVSENEWSDVTFLYVTEIKKQGEDRNISI